MGRSQPGNRHFIYAIAFIAAIGGFLFGYDTGIISGALIFLQKTFPMTTFDKELVVSSVVFGALGGAIFCGRLADIYGRRRMLLLAAFAFLIGTALTCFAYNIMEVILGRLIIGIAIGIASFTTPLFISEMAPSHKRGQLVLLNAIAITGGEAIAFLVDYLLADTHSWRIMFATGFFPAVCLLIGMFFLPATPRWMILKGWHERAKDVLMRIRASSNIESEFAQIHDSVSTVRAKWHDLFQKKYWPVLCIGLGLGVLQQFVGINTVMYYGPFIFQAAGFKGAQTQIFATFLMGIMNMLMSIVAVLLVDRIGRRKLLLNGLSIAGGSLLLVGCLFHYHLSTRFADYTILILLLTYIGGYSVSLGACFWLIISEIYPIKLRGLAMSFVTAVQWGANFLVAISFLSILNYFGSALTFWLYALMCILAFLFCYYLVPETKGISLEQIEQNLHARKQFRQLGEET